MKLKSVEITGLFDMFDYDISFKNSDNILIVSGANGFGKTMILNIIFNLFNRNFFFFLQLVFRKITLSLSTEIKIELEKTKKFSVTFSEYDKKTKKYNVIESYVVNKSEKEIHRIIESGLPNRMLDDSNLVLDLGGVSRLSEIVAKYSNSIPEDVSNSLIKINSQKILAIFDSVQTHLIKEQRLFKKISSSEKSRFLRFEKTASKEQSIFIDAIHSYSNELRQFIAQDMQKSFGQTQILDSSYLDRLIDEKNKITKEDYIKRINLLNEKQDKLIKFGLNENKQKVRDYSAEDAKALLVYINDLETKLRVFDDLLQKLELFTTILNERRFTFKTINISKEKGFYFKTSQGKDLDLNHLSSGEQHEVVLLYELIFNVKSDTLVLIDEPEISLHISWQKEFLNDLIKITEIQNIQVMVATHAPAIINDRWDLVYNLEARTN